MIETDKQRRWWFATHPEFSRHRTRQRERNHRLEEDWKLFQQALERDRMGLEPDPHTLLDLFPYRRFITAPVQAFRNLFTGMAGHTILNVARRGEAGGPGKWVEVARRGGPSLEHQSRMSGQPIRETGGKYSIREYDVNGVKFDDYKDGKLYEYKTRLGHLFDKNHEFNPWVKDAEQFRDQARRQTTAAEGMPVIWKVGTDLVEPLKKAVGKVPGVTIKP
ncbi:MAG TPA: Tox-REase-5 domain-containing protein [Desulfomonilaceae bacterium]|nr:Tox-REase-5 domain-containing protein [Desulfomonilaceae bacterium]